MGKHTSQEPPKKSFDKNFDLSNGQRKKKHSNTVKITKKQGRKMFRVLKKKLKNLVISFSNKLEESESSEEKQHYEEPEPQMRAGKNLNKRRSGEETEHKAQAEKPKISLETANEKSKDKAQETPHAEKKQEPAEAHGPSKDIKLTKKQQEAVEYLERPLLIVAGPGTGKTRVLTHKVLHLVDKGYDPNKILVTTFTIKAAEELKERLRKKLGDKVENMQISTMHSFCQKMLQTFPEYYGFFEPLDELDQFFYVNHVRNRYGAADSKAYELTGFYNKCTENDVDPEKLVDSLTKKGASDEHVAIARSYSRYIEDLLDPGNKRLDFAMLQREFYRLLKNNKEVLSRVRDAYDYILIDEYQDTNPIQDAIFRLISKPKYKITVVGDEDQSIYGFRGASIKNFRDFPDRYPEVKTIKLEENFRSNKEIVNAFDLFMKPHRTFQKTVFTKNPEFSSPILLSAETPEEEAEKLAEWIKKLVREHNVKYRDVAILFRSIKKQPLKIMEELEKQKIPFVIPKDEVLLEQDEIRDLLHLMSYVNSHTPNDHQKRLFESDILESEYLDLNKETIKKLSSAAEGHETLESFDLMKIKELNLSKKDERVLKGLVHLKNRQSAKPENQSKIVYKILEKTEYLARLFEKYEKQDVKSEIKIRNLANLSKIIFKIEKNTDYSKNFNSLFYQLSTAPNNNIESLTAEEIEAVKLMTVHKAKGLEFPAVILPGATHKRYNDNPQKESEMLEIPKELMLDKTDKDKGAELRRIFYVGMSRAQKILAVSTIDGKYRKPSEFIQRMGRETLASPEQFKKKFKDTDHYQATTEKTRLSYSSVSAYIGCPFRFFCRDYLGFETPIAMPYQKWGIIVHNALKSLHIQIKEGKKVKIQDIEKIVDRYYDDALPEWKDKLVKSLWNYYEKTPSLIKEVLDVEKPFSYIDSDLVITGQADLVVKNSNNEIEIIDYKSRQKKALESMTGIDTQLRLYNIGLKNNYDHPISKISAYAFEDNARKQVSNSPQDLDSTKKKVAKIKNSIENKKFKRNWKGPLCVTKSGKCEFYSVCNKLEENPQKP